MRTRAVPSSAPTALQSQAEPGERSALAKVMWFSILQVVGLGVGWVAGFYLYSTIFSTVFKLNLSPNATPAQVGPALAPIFQALSVIIPVSAAFALIGLVLLTLAFRGLAKFDKRFSVPSTFMIIMIVGLVIAAVGVIPVINAIPGIIANPPSTSGTPSAAFASVISSLVLGAAVAGLGVLLVVIGLIGGQILGLWRVGSRYDETIIKLGAIFAVIPLLNAAAPILVLIGVLQVRGRLPAS